MVVKACMNCGRDIGDYHVCPYCDARQAISGDIDPDFKPDLGKGVEISLSMEVWDALDSLRKEGETVSDVINNIVCFHYAQADARGVIAEVLRRYFPVGDELRVDHCSYDILTKLSEKGFTFEGGM